MKKNPDKEDNRLLRKSYLWALSFLKPYGVKICMLIVCGIFAVAGETLAPIVVQYVVDDVVPNKDMNLFFILIGSLIVINVLMLIAKNIRNLLQLTIGELASRDMRNAIFQQLRRLGFEHYEKVPAGETLALFNTEVAQVTRIYRNYLPGIIENLLFVCITFGLMLGISGWMTLIILPTFLMYYLFGPYFQKKAVAYGKMSGENRVKYAQKIYEAVSGFREFRSFGVQNWYHDGVRHVHKQWADVYRKAATFGCASGSFRRLTFYLGFIAVVLLGVYLERHDMITLGGFIAFLLLYMTTMSRLTMLVTQLTEQRLIINHTLPLYQFMRQKVLVEDPTSPIQLGKVEGRITFEQVGFGYRERPNVICDFSLDIMAGERVAFVGTSGSGKTTLLKLIGRFYDPTVGEVRIDGIPIRKMQRAELREAIGYVFQETYLFGSSVKENIRFGKPDATDAEVVEAAKAAYAHDFIMELPDGYDTLVGERGIKLSGGQKQRISIARLFIKQPAIVLLDEATSALDNVSELEVLKALDNILAGRTVVAIAHRLSTVKNFDRIVLVHEGNVAEFGTYEELIARRGLFYQLEQGEETA
ncbi:ABC transporter ATP-binding protein [Bacillus alkalicellulosilyticus]|uniref:ABC transporter ATP-binding protein n=1 Tax=Alkalihalobacterium alkalicellulosilyticum TaxID=1912214 RepID=UPI0009988674|nr:ABC transporter ATP-binding protein [Bacillus alkalicellulosilyticus]